MRYRKIATTITMILSLSVFTLFAQKNQVISNVLKNELKQNKILLKHITSDLNCDNKNDYAVVLQDKKHKKKVLIYFILSTGNIYEKKDSFVISDTMDLTIRQASKSDLANTKIHPQCNGLIVDTNDRTYLFSFDETAQKVKLIWTKHWGP